MYVCLIYNLYALTHLMPKRNFPDGTLKYILSYVNRKRDAFTTQCYGHIVTLRKCSVVLLYIHCVHITNYKVYDFVMYQVE